MSIKSKEKLLYWFLFSVIIGLSPFAIQSIMELTRGNRPTTIFLFSDGELLLIAAAITAGAVGNLFISGNKYKVAKTIAGWFCVCVIILSSAWFAIVSIEANSASFDAAFTSVGSVIMFFFAVISSAASVILAELR